MTNSESIVSFIGQGSGFWVLVAGCWLLGGFWVLGFGCGVASWEMLSFVLLWLIMGVTGLGVTGSWVLGTRCWVLGETRLMLEIDSWFSALVVTVPDEEDCWVSTFVETSEDKAGFRLPASGF